jgi:hypothetical protein
MNTIEPDNIPGYNAFAEEHGDEALYDPHYNEMNEDAFLDAAYEDRYADGYEPDCSDADALASAGWGTDEDYGYYGEEEF